MPLCIRWQILRSFLLVFTWGWNCALCFFTCSCWCLCAVPIFFYPYCRNKVVPLCVAVSIGKLITDKIFWRESPLCFNSLIVFAVGVLWVLIIFTIRAIAIYEGALQCSPTLQTFVECSATLYYVLPMFDNSTGQGQNSTDPIFGSRRRLGF